MSDKDNILDMSRRARLSGDITLLMLKGAGAAAAVLFIIWMIIALLALFGREVLPERSRDTPDPIIRSEVIAPAPETRIG